MTKLLGIFAIGLLSVLSGSVAGAVSANIETSGNILMLSQRPMADPLKFFSGPDLDHGLYIFVQERPQGLWAGVETFVRPVDGSGPANGYGALPFRIWGSNILVEENGVLVAKELVTSKLVLQEPQHTPSGGLTWDPEDLGTYFARDGSALVLYHNGKEVQRWQ